MTEHEKFMAIAIEEANAGAAMGEQPFGAVVARNGELIARARSLKVSTSDTTAHSETLAIKYATQKLGQPVRTIFIVSPYLNFQKPLQWPQTSL